jgi:DNA-binding NtrC family response regulator
VDSVAPAQADVVLVADADGGAGQALAAHLARRGFRAAHTAAGQDALRLAHAGRLAAAIVDVALDDMSGHALVSRLKSLDPRIPVLMTTGDFRPELEVRARQIGILHYAHKPADPVRIETIVSRAIGLARPA